jgi:signal transduction histidine kinase/CheY-like chemotaxis protein
MKMAKKPTYEELEDRDKGLETMETAQKKVEGSNKYQSLLYAISGIQQKYILKSSHHEIFGDMLEILLKFTESEYGFIGEIFYTDEGTPYLKSRAISNIAWSEATRKYYQDHWQEGLRFNALDTLFGRVITSKQAVIANDPINDPRSKGVPEGHPSLKFFLGLPIFQGDQFVGMMGMANRPNGYDQELIEELQPLISTCSTILSALKNEIQRKQAEEENKKLEAQLFQSQKMESVGRLASGVAHDYNNMLSVILGNTDMALDKVGPNDPLRVDLQEILMAAKRSADITHQLLAFARKQTIAPKVLNLNDAIEGMLKMLRKLIGEDIDLAWLPLAGLWPVKIDPSQLDQILANLCVNARDAIANVGKVTIKTHNATFGETYCTDHPGFFPGEFVLLAVSDDGTGMDKETLDNLFEPFYTTKEVGRGTGLGLATIYGIVKQNNGFINVYSEAGKGTTFKIYLPRHAGEGLKIRAESAAENPKGRGETVLVVEDEASILKLANRILDGLGYNVLTARTPAEAMALTEEHAGELHLLITDVVMPEMNGRELAGRLHVLNPDLKTLFMSGYTADVIAHRGVLEEGVCFMPKPFSIKDLAVKVREALD